MKTLSVLLGLVFFINTFASQQEMIFRQNDDSKIQVAFSEGKVSEGELKNLGFEDVATVERDGIKVFIPVTELTANDRVINYDFSHLSLNEAEQELDELDANNSWYWAAAAIGFGFGWYWGYSYRNWGYYNWSRPYYYGWRYYRCC